MIGDATSKRKVLNPWHFIWIAAVIAEVFAALMAIMLHHFDPAIDLGYTFKVGAVEALSGPLIVALIVIYFLGNKLFLKRMNLPTGHEIAEPKQMEEGLQQAKQVWERTFDAIADPIMILDTSYRIVKANKAMSSALEAVPDRLIGMTCYEGVHDNKEPPKGCPHAMLLADGQAHSQEIYEPRIGGHFLVSVFPLHDSSGKLMGSVHAAHNITDRKKVEDERMKRHTLESVGVLAGGIAHDLNNMLSSIIGNIDVAKDMVQKNERVVKRLSTAEEICYLASELSDRLITFSPGGNPVTRTISLLEILPRVINNQLRDANISVVFNLQEELYPVNVDERQIEQVIKNLTTNAKEAMPNGGTLTVHAENHAISSSESRTLKEGKYVKISMSDTGKGIPGENLAKIFDAYYTTKDTYYQKGLGLGLAVCYSVIKKHHGMITVESDIGKGTTFYIYLPAELA
jgi:PAS domain S-box-containing protein